MGHKVGVINMDISEAFDCLNHELLMSWTRPTCSLILLEVTSQIDISAVNQTIPLEIGEKL